MLSSHFIIETGWLGILTPSQCRISIIGWKKNGQFHCGFRKADSRSKKNEQIEQKYQKTLDKRRKHVLDYMTLILDLVHFLEVIHNIWISAVVIFLFSGRLW